MKRRRIHRIGLIGAIILLGLIPAFRKAMPAFRSEARGLGACALPMRPWRNIGGCGAGGSGGGSSGIRWVGRGVSGAVLDVEFMPKINFGQTFLFSIAEPC